jgi:hypothetical protein
MILKVNLLVSAPIVVSEGVFKTVLTHPKLDGELSFFHGENNRFETLSAITNSLIDDINEALSKARELMKK